MTANYHTVTIHSFTVQVTCTVIFKKRKKERKKQGEGMKKKGE
jgi:hypothetical protein